MAYRDSFVVPKLNWHLLPLDLLEPVVQVFQHGRDKYGAWNWMSPPYFAKHVVLNSAMRHLAALQRGEYADQESGLPHAAHLACNAIFALYYEVNNLWTPSEEDMPRPPTLDIQSEDLSDEATFSVEEANAILAVDVEPDIVFDPPVAVPSLQGEKEALIASIMARFASKVAPEMDTTADVD